MPMKLAALCAYLSNLFQNNETDMPEIHVTENGMLKLLKALNNPKLLVQMVSDRECSKNYLKN